MGTLFSPAVLRSRGMTCLQTARARQKAEGPALPNGNRQILLIRRRNAKIILTSDSQINLTDSHFPFSPPSPSPPTKQTQRFRQPKQKTSPIEADILDSSHPQHRWNFSHKSNIASQTTALMNGRPSEFTSQVNHAQFHRLNLLFPPSRRVPRPRAAQGGCQFGPFLLTKTFLRDAVARRCSYQGHAMANMTLLAGLSLRFVAQCCTCV